MNFWSKIRLDLHFWEKYWIFVASLFSGSLIGFGLSGNEVKHFVPFVVILWSGLLVFHFIFRKKEFNASC